MTLTREETAALQKRLKEAEASYHELMLGQVARVFVDQNGERVEYAAANAERLRAYITSLKIELGIPLNIVGPLRTRIF